MPPMTAPNNQPKKTDRPPPGAPVHAIPSARSVLNGVPWLPSNAFPLQRLDGRPNLQQGVALRLILTGLMESGAKLQSGRIVDGPMDAIAHLLERAAEEIGVTKTGDYPGKFVTPR